jgi:hypothetical protein
MLKVILRNGDIANAIDHRVVGPEHICLGVNRWMGLKPKFPELQIASLEARQTVFFTFIEAKVISSTKEACVTEPLPFWDDSQRWVEAEHMEAWNDREWAWESQWISSAWPTTVTAIAK